MTAIADLKKMTVIAENSIYLFRALQDADKAEYLRTLRKQH